MKNRNNRSLCFLGIIAATFYIRAQLATDTLLFKIPLINDASRLNLFNINGTKKASELLAGPVAMKDDNLLFYSDYGYVLYSQKGSVIDSFSIFKSEKQASLNDPDLYRLAFPTNNTSLLFYKRIPHGVYLLTLFEKKTSRIAMKPFNEEEYRYFEEIQNRHTYNIAFNAAVNDLVDQYQIMPRLVGFTTVSQGDKWWSADKIITFASPIVHEKDGTFKDLFPGIDAQQAKINLQTVEHLQLFTRDNRWFFTGISSGIGTCVEKNYQTCFVFDQAANLLYTDTLLKTDNADAVIGEDEKTYYTVTKVKRSVFKPGVGETGDLFYAIIDYGKKTIDVRKRNHSFYKASPCEPALANLMEIEECVELVPSPLKCAGKNAAVPAIPAMIVLDQKKKKSVRAQEKHLIKEGYMCYICRSPVNNIKKRLTNCRSEMPKILHKTIDSLSNEPGITCPYSLLLTGPNGVIRSFAYPPGDAIVCARILSFIKNDELLVRVDCTKYAEALLFKTDGTFVNRFVFNRKSVEERLDILVAVKNGPIIELDYETAEKGEKYLEWKRYLSD